MGKSFSKMIGRLFGKKQFRVLLLGLDAAGKTTILNKLAHPDDVVETVPTVGFNVEKIKLGNLKFVVWDVSGQDQLRPFWRHYYRGTAGIIFVVDSSDKQRFSLARSELHDILREEELQYACLLVLANKQVK
eukprot:TRINITY_DN66190_c11_g4_i2.p1 TRINITY_DN66190_c11_g4~~TRINITY_DN66190_c11_g4_i2.p1  ORF type:complete len:132 (+),score=64.93 TRINITY_DN66190_c11_g4_i2:196-591(+)